MKGAANVLDKKVPESKKYAHVTSSLDTGASAKKQQPVVSSAAALKRRDEIFKRIRPATLARMLEERDVNESVFALGSVAGDRGSQSSVAGMAPIKAPTAASMASVSSVAGSVLSVVDSEATATDGDLVLLDLRDADEYEVCHLPKAESYPATKINRDQFIPELLRCKRDPKIILVVYHKDEQATAAVATQLVQKGWETVYALNGGFEEMVQSYPEVLQGEVPDRPETGGTSRSSRTAKSRAKP
mmetsp:Transcript_69281/g.150801  ORF Transcript_69281/g.150801 Transcript_69281/m.150801 type:complete len:244 (+) Transcript_69281:36-767(+)|eukprot:CAMPEP_0170618366 /NCGR_PEP_ID=MMETSP0224-20130122/26919_1 /TAXON_ID=285029 /ORGANISM="Togula jolla, Strain CCCM 725" /LENGTH=243 /DNA_ID=CAMNT_0010944333 /DNA_START=31 /DNA_END=762 /DNA_ORIENTATION=+